MNKKQAERIATIALAAFLVGMFFYQVAYGTNESSYKFGYSTGISNYESCVDNSYLQDCSAAMFPMLSCNLHSAWNMRYQPDLTNSTACVGGFVNGGGLIGGWAIEGMADRVVRNGSNAGSRI